ncbi:MAG TPA: AAA family ATPase [Candidatus Saccharimonadales bacterium]|jgi:predicted kinase
MSQVDNKLIVICGLPGSGKTTLAKRLAEETPAVRLCPDEWMQDLGVTLWDETFRDKLEVRLWKLGYELLKLGQSVILEYGFWAKSERDEKLHTARLLGVGVELHYLDVPTDELQTRLGRRGMEGDDVLVEKVEEYSQRFERPNEAELKQYDNYSRS